VADDLRDRIAALLELLRPVTPVEAADAVIRELGLRQEIVTESLTDLRTGSAPTESTMHRYVTEWKWTTDD
jgi:hypothetical protein